MDKVKLVSSTTKNGKVFFLLDNDKMLEFEDCWLRDNCRCSICYHADMFQRAVSLLDIPESKVIKIESNDFTFIITWDDNHTSSFEVEFLIKNVYTNWLAARKVHPVLWKGPSVMEKVARVQAKEFLNSVEGAKAVFKSLLDYGFALIEGVEGSTKGTEPVCKALGGVQHTLFGGMWEFTNQADDHADSAYTTLPLVLHNDNTYFTETAGLIVLHCLKHTDGSGGETTLVDGFHGATRLKEQFPEDFQLLSKYDLEAEYKEEGHHHRHAAPVIQVDKLTKNLKQIRYNTYDRAPMAFSKGEECRAYYRALRNLARFYEDADNQVAFKLTPGLVVVMDNFRVLHGRKAFTGNRVLCGSYVSRSDWLDRARTLELIE